MTTTTMNHMMFLEYQNQFPNEIETCFELLDQNSNLEKPFTHKNKKYFMDPKASRNMQKIYILLTNILTKVMPMEEQLDVTWPNKLMILITEWTEFLQSQYTLD
jgi:hypothetical protein